MMVHMRVLLIYSNRSRIIEPVPPIGLSYVATATQEAGHDVRFLDMMVSSHPEEELDTLMRQFNPEVVGISVRNIDTVIPQQLSCHLGEAEALITSIRNFGKKIIVLGGPAISVLKSQAIRRLNADYAIVGEGESSFPRLLKALEERGDLSEIEGLCYFEEGKIRENPPVRQAAFGSSGMENWTSWEKYNRAGGTFAIHTKRGCALGCLYCNYPSMEGHSYRYREPGDVVDEIERVKKEAGPRTFEFTDTTFNLPTSHATAICEEILRRNLKVNLSAVGVNPLGITRELLGLMKKAGFLSMIISADAANDTMLANLRKGFTMEHVLRSAALLREFRIHNTWFFLLGGPGETDSTVEETLTFAENHLNYRKCLTVVMTGIRVLPDTPLARTLLEKNILPSDTDLAGPVFYFSPELDERRVLDRINLAIARCPTIVHGGEQDGSPAERFFYRALHTMGAAPPYMRFLPHFLCLPFLPTLRAKTTHVPETQPGIYLAPGSNN